MPECAVIAKWAQYIPPIRTSLPILYIFSLLLLISANVTSAQEDTPANEAGLNHPWTVFLRRDVNQTGLDELIFVDMLTGENTVVETTGEQYTPISEAVMFFNPVTRQVMLATPDGRLREHPFIQLELNAQRVDWVIADDTSMIAWTLTGRDPQNRLSTVTKVAGINGSDEQTALADVDQTGSNLRTLPLAFSKDLSTLYMDVHPDGISQFTPYALYASVFGLDLETREATPLPGEPANCLCGADVANDLFVRLRLTSDVRGFDVHVHDLGSQFEQTIPALRLTNYTTAGDVLISPDGRYTVYALAQVSDFGTPDQSIQTVFVLVDLQAMTQEELTRPVTTFVRPVAWTEDNSAVIFTSPVQDGTWKVNLADGQLVRIAEGTYLGRLQN